MAGGTGASEGKFEFVGGLEGGPAFEGAESVIFSFPSRRDFSKKEGNFKKQTTMRSNARSNSVVVDPERTILRNDCAMIASQNYTGCINEKSFWSAIRHNATLSSAAP